MIIQEAIFTEVFSDMKRIKIFDIVIIISSLLFGIGLFVMSLCNFNSNGERFCVIKISGDEVRRIDLNNVHEDEIIKIKNDYGENHIRISRDGVSVIYTDCPGKVEVKETPINKIGQSLVCLPHRLTIEIIGDGSSPDAVAY